MYIHLKRESNQICNNEFVNSLSQEQLTLTKLVTFNCDICGISLVTPLDGDKVPSLLYL